MGYPSHKVLLSLGARKGRDKDGEWDVRTDFLSFPEGGLASDKVGLLSLETRRSTSRRQKPSMLLINREGVAQ